MRIKTTFVSAVTLALLLGGGSVAANDIDLTQSGANHTADVNQQGANHKATVEQTEDNANSATIDQAGRDHVAEIFQRGGDDVGHTATIDQSGGESGGNFASIGSPQQQWAWEQSMEAHITQDGSNNHAEIAPQQGGVGGNTAEIDQAGDDNRAAVSQMVGGNEATITQDGVGNIADVNQRADSWRNTATVDQLGDSHEALVDQTGADNSEVMITQNDSDSFAEVVQTGGTGHSAMIETSEGGNVNLLQQDGTGSYADVGVDASTAQATIQSNGGVDTNHVTTLASDYGTMNVTQVGDGHTANITQSQ